MMTTRSLAEVGLCLSVLQDDIDLTATPQSQYEHIENIAIAILDSEFGNYAEGALEEYLQAYLLMKRLELNLNPLPVSQVG